MDREQVLTGLLAKIAREGYLERTMDDSRYFVIESRRTTPTPSTVLKVSYVEYEILRRLMEDEDR